MKVADTQNLQTLQTITNPNTKKQTLEEIFLATDLYPWFLVVNLGLNCFIWKLIVDIESTVSVIVKRHKNLK